MHILNTRGGVVDPSLLRGWLVAIAKPAGADFNQWNGTAVLPSLLNPSVREVEITAGPGTAEAVLAALNQAVLNFKKYGTKTHGPIKPR